MRLGLKILAWSVGMVAVLVIALVLFIALFDWNRLKPTIDDKVSAAIGRPFVIRGELTAAWQREPSEPGLRRLVPWPTFTARAIGISNPPWAQQSQLVQLDALAFRISPLPLLLHHIYVPTLRLIGLHADLERNAQGEANWQLALEDNQPPSRWKPTLGTVGLDQGDITVDDAKTRLDLHVTIRPLQQAIPYDQIVAQASNDARTDVGHDVGRMVNEEKTPPDLSTGAKQTLYQFAWNATGTYRGDPVDGNGKTGAVLALQRADEPFPVQARVHIDNSKIALVGTLTDPMHLGALNMRVWFAGTSMARLYPILGIALPDTPPFATEGHLSAQLHAHGSHFSYRDFRGRVGESDLGGNMEVTTSGPRLKLSGDVHSQLLRFVDLGPLVGAQPEEHGNSTLQPQNKALPVQQFHTNRLLSMDADVTFEAMHIERPGSLPIDALGAHVYLDNGVLKFNPLRASVAGGSIEGNLSMDANTQPVRTTLDMHAHHLQLKQLFPTVQSMQTSFGEINGEANLSGNGSSVSGLLSHSDGELKLLMNNGAISKTLLEAAGLNVANVVIEKLFGDKTVEINCAAVDMAGSQGVFTNRLFVLDTSDATVEVRGTIRFSDEHLDLDVVPHTKGMRLFSLRSPLYVKGTFKDPDVGVKPGPLLLRGGGAVALAVLAAPAAALLAVIVPSRGEQPNQCQQVLSQLRSGPLPGGARK
ncbi:AsmA family protein [Dyella choica]|uniref:AsmA family protein n=1 Tax=Dyella choica TaxID=1927959 RepID=A0A3S0PLQ6_9GAMM|nr:AsmA family protein [Dyella choica]RUL80163.1 AsmA family protein [Dyella choica]